jgi:hypothetical protein
MQVNIYNGCPEQISRNADCINKEMDIPKTNSHHWLMGGLPWPGRGSV